jgi:DNA-directed RNA polymerase subunit F|tara:strand:- start:348 stop:716 length:369 start_codon:yes stop_codon:yes gene_type:complete
MTEEERFVDFATVRTLLLDAEKRRKNLTYEQKAALQHAEWAASDARNGYKTDPDVFQSLKNALGEVESLSAVPDLAAKLAELMPLYPNDVKAVFASKRITNVSDEEITTILELVRQHIGFVE